MVRLNKTKPEGYMQPLAVSVDLLLPGPSFFLHRGASSTKQPTLCLKATRFVPEEWASCRRSLNAALLNDRNRGVIRLVSPRLHLGDLCHTFTSAGLGQDRGGALPRDVGRRQVLATSSVEGEKIYGRFFFERWRLKKWEVYLLEDAGQSLLNLRQLPT